MCARRCSKRFTSTSSFNSHFTTTRLSDVIIAVLQMKKRAMSLGELKQKNLRAQIQYRVATSFFLPISKQIAFPFLLYVKKNPNPNFRSNRCQWLIFLNTVSYICFQDNKQKIQHPIIYVSNLENPPPASFQSQNVLHL